jgi:hypothetical protein
MHSKTRRAVLGVAAALTMATAACGGGANEAGGDGDTPEEDPRCPLTGEEARDGVAEKRALAVKVENLAEARPQAGLDRADVVYEQPVEGGITRFVLVFHCRGAQRIGPVRSGRLVDADLLVQLGDPVFGYAGGVQQVKDAIGAAGVTDVNYINAPEAYERDPSKTAPHDLYSSTRQLYDAAGGEAGQPPPPLFTYDEAAPEQGDGSRRGTSLQLSADSSHWREDVIWRYDEGAGGYLRSHGGEAHTVEDGSQVTARNVIVQVVDVVDSPIVDAAGNPSPEVAVLGRGKAILFRDGRRINGRWERQNPGDATVFTDRDGNEVALAPGTTWVELYPSDGTVNFRV